MKRSAYSEARDQRIADETVSDSSQMCAAHGCPRWWAVQGERGRACSAHYFAPRSEWPRITEMLQREETERALERASSEVQARSLTREDKRALLARLRELGRDPGSDRGWAEWLRQQHADGRRLTRFQVDAYMAALKGQALRQASFEPLPQGVRP